MKKVALIFLLYIVSISCNGQSNADSITTTWTKYLVVNDRQQIMLQYDTYYKAWELEGAGYEGPITLRNLMDSIALNLGFKYDSYKLGGLFTYQKPQRYRVTLKPVYIVHFSSYINGISFTDTANTKWFNLEDAKKLIPYPTMNLIIDQLMKFPNNVWGGAFEEYNYNKPGGTKWRIIEPFYKLKD